MGPLLGSPGGLTAVIYTDALQTVIMVGGALVLMFLGKEGSCTHPSFAPKSLSHLPLLVTSVVWSELPRAQNHTPLQARGRFSLCQTRGAPPTPHPRISVSHTSPEPRDPTQNWELVGHVEGPLGSEGCLTPCGLSPQASRRWAGTQGWSSGTGRPSLTPQSPTPPATSPGLTPSTCFGTL